MGRGKMNLRLGLVLVLCCAIPGPARSQQPSEMRSTTDQLAASVYNGPSMQTLGELTDSIGGRLTGGPEYVRATEWAVAKFKSFGIQNVEPRTVQDGCRLAARHG